MTRKPKATGNHMTLEFPISLRGSVLLSSCVRVVAYSSSAAQLNLFHLFPSDRRNLVKKCFSKIGSVLSTRPDFRCNNKNSGISNKSDYPEKKFHQSLGQKNCWLGKNNFWKEGVRTREVMKPDMLPICEFNSAVQNKLVQAQKEVKMMQTQQQVSSQVSIAKVNKCQGSVALSAGYPIF